MLSQAPAIIRFEPEGRDLPGYWGQSTSSIDWCENNYHHSVYIAEFFNTISNVGLILSGLVAMCQAVRYGFEFRFVALGFFGIVVGLGSAAFHCTLQYWAQMWDEVPMVWSMLVWFYIFLMMDKPGSWPLALALTLYGIVWSLIHYNGAFVTEFQVHFILMVVTGIVMLARNVKHYCRLSLFPVSSLALSGVDDAHRKLRIMAQLYVVYILVAFAFWLLDQFACPTLNNLPRGIPNPQLHAWWHLFGGINVHFGLQFTMALRQSIVDSALPCTVWHLRGNIGLVFKTPKHLVGALKKRNSSNRWMAHS